MTTKAPLTPNASPLTPNASPLTPNPSRLTPHPSSLTPIPFLDLITPHRELEEELIAVFRKALQSAAFIGGPMVQAFEEDFARFCGTDHCIGVGSGTDALRFALMAGGVNQGDTVLTVPNTFIATTEAISQAGATPDFVDVDERTSNMDPPKLAQYLDEQCRPGVKSGQPIHRKTGSPVTAVVPVHLYGQPAAMDPIRELAAKHRLIVIEDACQAHGAEYLTSAPSPGPHRLTPHASPLTWTKAGSLGLAAAFSFYPGKNLGACGEAGAVTTNDPRIAAHIRKLRDHGQAQKYYHDLEGYNGRLDAIMAGILQVKLARLDQWNARRRACAARYAALLADLDGVTIPFEDPNARSVYHLYVIRTRDRDRLQQYLTASQIGTGLHYPAPLHLQEAYRHRGYQPGDYPVAERLARELLSLPMHPGLTEAQQVRVAEAVRQGLRNGK